MAIRRHAPQLACTVIIAVNDLQLRPAEQPSDLGFQIRVGQGLDAGKRHHSLCTTDFHHEPESILNQKACDFYWTTSKTEDCIPTAARCAPFSRPCPRERAFERGSPDRLSLDSGSALRLRWALTRIRDYLARKGDPVFANWLAYFLRVVQTDTVDTWQ